MSVEREGGWRGGGASSRLLKQSEQSTYLMCAPACPGQSDKKALTTFFLFCFLVLSLFNKSQMVNFKEIYHFSRF